jgi:hypothetical protein
MAVVIDAVLLVQLLDVAQRRLGVGADAFRCMEQDVLERLETLFRCREARPSINAARRFSIRTGTSTRSILIGGPAFNRCCPKTM